jgi:hypothetical protein
MEITQLSLTGLVLCEVNAADMLAVCRLLADGSTLLWRSSEIWEKCYSSFVFFFHSACSVLLLLLIICFQFMKLHQMCMFFVLDNIVYKLWTILLQTFIASRVTNAMDEALLPWHTYLISGESEKRTMCRLVFHWCVKFPFIREKMQFAWSSCQIMYWNFGSLVPCLTLWILHVLVFQGSSNAAMLLCPSTTLQMHLICINATIRYLKYPWDMHTHVLFLQAGLFLFF